jgi:hypothetical protein
MDRRTVSQNKRGWANNARTLGPNGRTIGAPTMFTVSSRPSCKPLPKWRYPMDELRAWPDANAMIPLIVSPRCL